MKSKLCFASNNEHKLREVKDILDSWFQVLSLKDIGCEDELPETTGTIPGNSREKAAYAFEKFNMDCFADDSGLEVYALHNSPGVDSAIYAGPQRSHEDNIRLLLKNLDGVDNRAARFITVVTLIESGKIFQFEGILGGKIIRDKRGTGGFGYDPVFIPEGYDKTLAEMSLDEKNSISHRAQAIRKLVDFLKLRNPTS